MNVIRYKNLLSDFFSSPFVLRFGPALLFTLPFLFVAFEKIPSSSQSTLIEISENTKGEPGVGGIGLVMMNPHAASEADEAFKDQLLGADPEAPKIPKEEAKTAQEEWQEPGKIKYKLKRGETLAQVAKRYNISQEAIAGSSGIRIIDEVYPGTVLYIPTKNGFFYSVRNGERLAKILQKHNVSLEKFLSENPDVNPDILGKGEEIFLPGAKPKNIIRSYWIVPVQSRLITSPYGHRTWPRNAFHKGVDLKAQYVAVRAARGGEVIFAGWLGGYGNAIVIKHDGEYKTLYAHMSKLYTSKGKFVSRGAVIGRSGNTGYSFGAHLHFEITKNGKPLNPAKVLRGLRYRRK
ncbi:MAG: peptidoglycan DD-metalloendopeptidase family protein [Leptospiraceae bacterium]|nr:peptidoglycan DD-metalloendopeptidase family protein [Leptospiraceae bacterium]